MVACVSTLFLFSCQIIFLCMIYHILFIHLSVDEHLNCFHSLDFMSTAALNIGVQVFVRTCVFILLGYMPRSEIAESCGNSMFHILRNHQTALQSHCTILHLHQLCTRLPVSPPPCQHLFLSVSYIISILRE